jgi:DNA-binding response OmpR family regulator
MNATILVADDEPMLRALLEHKLHNRGYRVVAVADGAAVLACLDAVRPDLIVLDAMMPGLDGFEVLRRLKADPTHRDIPVIMLTARRREQDVVSSFNLGVADYVPKPFAPEELVARIARILDRPARRDAG